MDVIQSYLYMCRFLAQATDGRLDDAEWSSMVVSLARHTRGLGYTTRHWQQAMDRSRDDYAALLRQKGPAAAVERFRECVVRLRDFGQDEPGILDMLLEEFHRRAQVDGHLDPMEEHFLGEVERAWRASTRALGTTPL